MPQRAFYSVFAIVLAFPLATATAQEQTPWEACQAHLEVAETDRLLAFRSCFQFASDEVMAGLLAAVQNLGAARESYAVMPRVDGDFYMARAANCDQERTVRAALERQALQLDTGTRRLRILLDVASRYPGHGDRLTLWAGEHGMVGDATPMITVLNAGIPPEEYERLLSQSQETLSDVRATDVENRCGSAEPLPDEPSGSDLAGEPEGSGERAGFTFNHSEDEYGHRYENLLLNGQAISACRHRDNCSDADAAAQEVCQRLGHDSQVGSGLSSHGEVETVHLWRELTRPSGSTVLRMVVCR